MTGVAKNTVVRLLERVGLACAIYHEKNVRNVRARRVQCDEIWTYVGAKAKNATRIGDGDIWTWTALDADSKLIISWLVGTRTSEAGRAFLHDLRSRIVGRVQLSTDGLNIYQNAVDTAFADAVDYGQVVKHYETPQEAEVRYSPPVCTGATRTRINGQPVPQHISTSYVERQNLTMRMQVRRFTRLTNGFSKKRLNLEYAVALHFMHYNFCRKHQTVKTTPAMAAGVASHVWTIYDILTMTEALEPAA
jgi:IS1 family transposase